MDHPYITSAKELGGFIKLPYLLTVSTVFVLTYLVGGSVRKTPKTC